MERLGYMDERYTRQIALPEVGEEGQQRLRAASVLVVGAGGLGSPLLLYLTAMGIGRLGIVDDDVVGLSNLQRQVLYTTEELGRSKAQAAQARLSALNPEVRIEVCPERLTEHNVEVVARGYDIVVDACDNYATRLLIDEVTARLGIPYIYGSVEGFVGQVSVFNALGAGRYRSFAGDAVAESEGRAGGVLGALPGVVGSIQAMEVVKLIVGCGEPLTGKLLHIDLLTNTYQTFTL